VKTNKVVMVQNKAINLGSFDDWPSF
jgi:hypothetical protein